MQISKAGIGVNCYFRKLPVYFHVCGIFQTNCNHAQLFSKLFDEVEKIQCWKVQTESETVQMERRLQENKRTIETQRKAIQELQVWGMVPLHFLFPLALSTYVEFVLIS